LPYGGERFKVRPLRMIDQLDPEECWEDPDAGIRVGDLFADLPLLSRELKPITAEDENGHTRAYLPTVSDLAVLFRIFPDSWWFLPVVTRQQFANPETFDRLLQHVLDGRIHTWFPLPPSERDAAGLPHPALVYVVRPTMHKPDLIEELELERLARLSEQALRTLGHSLCAAVHEGL